MEGAFYYLLLCKVASQLRRMESVNVCSLRYLPIAQNDNSFERFFGRLPCSGPSSSSSLLRRTRRTRLRNVFFLFLPGGEAMASGKSPKVPQFKGGS